MPGLWSGMQGARSSGIARPIVRPWRCFALCWSCGGEVASQPATCGETERPIRWFCPACDVHWTGYADRVELPAPVMAS
jgi:hypothetical protein